MTVEGRLKGAFELLRCLSHLVVNLFSHLWLKNHEILLHWDFKTVVCIFCRQYYRRYWEYWDSAISASETLFGSRLVLSGEFLDSPELASLEYLRRLQLVQKNSFTVLPHHSTVPSLKPDEIPPSLVSCSHVFIREDTSKPPLSLI